MTIEKLQKVATTHVDANLKARWLKWWNSSADVKTQNMFPVSLPLREKVIDEWLHMASFWGQVLQSFTCSERLAGLTIFYFFIFILS
jgi:hypothetical protein